MANNIHLTKFEAENAAFMIEHCINTAQCMGMCDGTMSGMIMNMTNLAKKLKTHVAEID